MARPPGGVCARAFAPANVRSLCASCYAGGGGVLCERRAGVLLSAQAGGGFAVCRPAAYDPISLSDAADQRLSKGRAFEGIKKRVSKGYVL